MPVLWNAPPLLLGPAIAAPMVYAVLPAAQRHRGRCQTRDTACTCPGNGPGGGDRRRRPLHYGSPCCRARRRGTAGGPPGEAGTVTQIRRAGEFSVDWNGEHPYAL